MADVAQIYMSLTPYNDSFEEELDLCKFDITRHRAAGMSFLPQDNRLISSLPIWFCLLQACTFHAGTPASEALGSSLSMGPQFSN